MREVVTIEPPAKTQNHHIMKTIDIYTDGACSGNPGKGGAAFVTYLDDSRIASGYAGYTVTTNNRMEIKAVIMALASLLDIVRLGLNAGSESTVRVFSDSQLVVNTMTQGWARKSNGDLWRILDEKIADCRKFGISVNFVKVKGHSGDPRNDEVDRLAVNAYSVEESRLFEDTGYAGSRIVGIEHPGKPVIERVTLEGWHSGNRTVKVDLSNGNTVKIAGYMGGFTQSGLQTDCFITLDIAEHFRAWLNGGEL